ncbi:PLP-dependent aminotransferase family protein, partial [Burkholderia sp. A1]|uniref:aminotransferase class I/II-fold pyridoxal phosphate-dependent enzyme n=1 Tax=Burkholderia sp. A1 TaxID=148446 RepID=UPI0004A7A5D0
MWDRSTRYGEIACRMQDEIDSGAFRSGDRLPSIRALCARFEASSATVTHALYLLEDAGVIVARRRSGFYLCDNPQATDMARRPSGEPVSYQALPPQRAMLMELDQHHDRDQPLLFAKLNPELYPVVRLQRIMTDLARRNPALFTSGCQPGSSMLEPLLARRGRAMGCDWSAEDVTVTLGGDECRRFLLRLLTQPGDTVAVASPCEFRLLEELDALGLKVLEIPAHPRHGLLIDTLDFALSREKVAACVLSANFPHPTGYLMSDDAKRRTVELLEKHQVPLIEDDRCGDLYFGKSRPLPFKAFDRTGRVHYVTDFGHLIGPGMSIGFAVTELR